MAYRSRLNPRKKRRRGLYWISLTVAVLLGSFYLISQNQTDRALESFIEGRELLQAGKLKDAQRKLATAVNDEALRPWVNLALASALEQQGKISQAIDLYRSIPPSTAPYLDAQLAIARLTFQTAPLELEQHQLLSALAEKAARRDIQIKLEFVSALNAIHSEPAEIALKALLQVRAAHPKNSFSTAAEKQSVTLLEQVKESESQDYLELMFLHIEALIREKRAIEALEELQKLERESETQDREYEFALLKERILRALSRNEEADRLLLNVSANGSLGTADRSMLMIARHAWNVNDHHRALQFLDRLQSLYPSSSEIPESLYVEGRVLEEVRQFPEARNLYSELSNTASDARLRIRATRQLAWMYLREDNYDFSKRFFKRLLSLSKQTKPTRQLSETDLRQIRQHASFWLLFIHSKMKEAEDLDALLSNQERDSLLAELRGSEQSSYYANLANEFLSYEAETTAISWDALAPAEFKEKCELKLPSKDRNLFIRLDRPALKDLRKTEIDWRSYLAAREGTGVKEARLQMTRISLYREFNLPYQHLKLAAVVYSNEKLDLAMECRASLRLALYPTPYQEFFREAAEASRIRLPLLYGVARTESHFDERATSIAGAAGLMQLMPATAKRLGLEEARIYEPEANVKAASKYLANLLNLYGREEVYALAAYNAGGAAVNRWRSRYPELPPQLWLEMVGYPETKEYVKKVLAAASVYENHPALSSGESG